MAAMGSLLANLSWPFSRSVGLRFEKVTPIVTDLCIKQLNICTERPASAADQLGPPGSLHSQHHQDRGREAEMARKRATEFLTKGRC
jgi:hypothetical protein